MSDAKSSRGIKWSDPCRCDDQHGNTLVCHSVVMFDVTISACVQATPDRPDLWSVSTSVWNTVMLKMQLHLLHLNWSQLTSIQPTRYHLVQERTLSVDLQKRVRTSCLRIESAKHIPSFSITLMTTGFPPT